MARRRGVPRAWIGVVALAATAIVVCRERGSRERSASAQPDAPAYYQAEVAEHPGAAIVVLVDTSGSMGEVVPRDSRPKFQVAREALKDVLAATDEFARRRPGYPIDIAIFGFSGLPWEVLPMRPYDREAVTAALDRLPRPGGGTAIGAALQAARVALYRSGDIRKYILAVTDGQNTVGSAPDLVARDIFAKSRGGVSISFVAFDTNPAAFGFLRDVGGDVAAAQDGPALQAALRRIYEGKILAEAEPGGAAPSGSAGEQPAAPSNGRTR